MALLQNSVRTLITAAARGEAIRKTKRRDKKRKLFEGGSVESVGLRSLLPDTAHMPEQPPNPQPPPLALWNVYKVASKAVWIGSSHTFRSRKQPKRVKKLSRPRHFALQARALRDNKVYIHAKQNCHVRQLLCT